MSIYNVAILCIITAPVTMVIADQENATFAFVSLANVFCCYLSMALVFVPKVSNTVRFLFDEMKQNGPGGFYHPTPGT